MKTQYTCGPWYVTEYAILAHNGGTHILDHPKLKWEKLASITGSRGNTVSKMISECEDNARLIALAPDLLDLLKSAVARVQIANEEGQSILSAWLPDAIAAIAKAEGKA